LKETIRFTLAKAIVDFHLAGISARIAGAMADHDPTTADEDRTLHGAACHGCLLVAETSCEARNLFLDRALILDTVAQVGAGFF
jgi:hypothetical protein